MDEEIVIKRQKAYAKRKEDEAKWQKANIERQKLLALQQKVDADLDKATAERERIKTERDWAVAIATYKALLAGEPTLNAFNKIFYTSEPPTPNAWNQVKQEAGAGWKKLLYV